MARPMDGGIYFLDAQYGIKHDSEMAVNIGGGLRWLQSDLLKPGGARIFGVSVWYDGEQTSFENYFNQFGLSLESLGENWDFRANANLPFGPHRQVGSNIRSTGEVVFDDVFLAERTLLSVDTAMNVYDFESAYRLFGKKAWIYAGGYHLEGDDVSEIGCKGGIRGYLTDDLLAYVTHTEDDVFGGNLIVGFTWFPGRSGGLNSCCNDFCDRLREPVLRNYYVAAQQEIVPDGRPLTDENGDNIRVVHADSNATAPGDGSFENPFTSLDDVLTGSQDGDIVFLHSGTLHNGEALVLREGQRALGEGDGNDHVVTTFEFGDVDLPESSPGAGDGPIPVIANAPDVAITVDNDMNEVSNIEIDGGMTGIASRATGVGDVNINRMTIENTIGDGIALTPFVETLDDDSTRVRFNPTIDEVVFDSVGGDDINLDAVTGEPDTTPVVENIQIANVTSMNGMGRGINITNNKSATTITDYDYDGGATAAGAFLFTDSEGTATVTNANVENGAGPGIDIQGGEPTETPVEVEEEEETSPEDPIQSSFTFDNVAITDTGGPGFNLEGGTTGITFNGKIEQGATASAIFVGGGHDGTVEFNEFNLGDGVIEATAGDGIQLDGADGVYTFNDTVTLNGGDAGIDVIGDSDATLTFVEANITSPTGTAFNIEGGAASVTLNGRIVQDNGAPTVAVSGDHTGTLIFNEFQGGDGSIAATNGDGIQFIDAHGAYTFNNEVTLTGVNEGIDITDSDGTFTFSDTRITDPTVVGINISGGTSITTFIGKIVQDANTTAISIGGGHTGTSIFNEIDAGDGVVEATDGDGIQFSNADGEYSFSHGVTLNGGNAGIHILNGSDGTMTFASSSKISNPTGVAFRVDNSAATVTYDGTIENDIDNAVVIDSNTGGTVLLNGDITGTGAGILVNDNTGGTFQFAGMVDLDTGASDAVTITNNSNSNTRFENLQINTTSGDGFVATNSSTVEVVGSNNIVSTTGTALNMDESEIGEDGVNFESISADGAVNGILLNNITGGQVNVGADGNGAGDGGAIRNTTGPAVMVTNVVNVSLNNLLIDTTGSHGVHLVHNDINGFSATIADSSISNAMGVGINLDASGANTIDFVSQRNNVDNTDDQGIRLDVNGSANVANITLNETIVVNSSNNEALLLVGEDAATKTINLLVEDSRFSNDSDTAVAADFQANGAVTMNSTVRRNFFFNDDVVGPGRAFEMSANDAGASVRLSLTDNTATSSGDDYFLEQNAGLFSVDNINTATPAVSSNVGTFAPLVGTITDDPGDIPLPP